MTDPTIIAARRYSELQPGYDLVDAVDAAIPFSWLGLDLLVQERRTLPVVDEVVLRLCQQNVNTIGEIAAVLGVDEEVVQVSVAGQLSQENVDYRPFQRPGQLPEQRIALTHDGVRTVTTLETTAPTRADLGWASTGSSGRPVHTRIPIW